RDLARGCQPDRAGDAGAADPAVARRVPGEVLLVVRLGVEERPGFGDLGRDLAVAGTRQRLLVAGPRREHRLVLRRRGDEDGGAVLRADVVALAHALRRVVTFPEDAEQLVVARLFRPEHDEHDLGMPGAARADLLVRGVRGHASCVADGGRVDPRELPEELLRPPEATHPE